MHIPISSLSDQHIQRKNKFHFGFVFLFIVSVGLNIFLLFFDQQNNAAVASLPQDTGIVSQISVKPSEVLEVPQPASVIKPVSFTVPSERALEGKAIHSLNFKIRNSLNFTVCRMITRENGCRRAFRTPRASHSVVHGHQKKHEKRRFHRCGVPATGRTRAV